MGPMTITVNGTDHQVHDSMLTFEQLQRLAGVRKADGCVYRFRAAHWQPDAILEVGEAVVIVDGMVFQVRGR
jgi:uridine kinase